MSVEIDALLRELVEKEASDLHIKAGQPPVMRIHGDLVRSNHPTLSPAETDALLLGILNEERKERLRTFRELDLSYEVPNCARFRVNMFWQRRQVGAVFRVIPFNIRTIDDLFMPQVCKSLALIARGLILVTGPTGSGKSTSLAAMIHHINTTKRSHIMTIEDPIEYVHSDKISVINQRELGTDTHSFAGALKHVMRQNPDVILVGEMRDAETIEIAIKAAETGHLVLSTVHTQDAYRTINRIIGVFPPEGQTGVRNRLSENLRATISQRLLPHASGKGRVVAAEIMVCNVSVQEFIKDPDRTHEIKDNLERNHDILGTQSFDMHLAKLLRDKQITMEVAKEAASNPSDFERALSFE